MNEVTKFKYNEVVIDFDHQNENLMINATQMAKIFDKQVNEFLSNKSTISFMEACLRNGNSRFLNVKTEEDLVTVSKKYGTFMHRVLALKFAAWLDSDFEVWVYTKIDEILFGKYREIEESLKASAVRKKKIEALRTHLGASKDFQYLEHLLLEERQASYQRGNTNKQQLELFKELLSEDQLLLDQILLEEILPEPVSE